MSIIGKIELTVNEKWGQITIQSSAYYSQLEAVLVHKLS